MTESIPTHPDFAAIERMRQQVEQELGPPDFEEALDRDADARRYLDGPSYSKKQRYVLQVEQAKTDETRQRRVAKMIGEL